MRDAKFHLKLVDTFLEIICEIMTKLYANLELCIFITQIIVFLALVLKFTFTVVKHNFNKIFNWFPILQQKYWNCVCNHSVYHCWRRLHYTCSTTTLHTLWVYAASVRGRKWPREGLLRACGGQTLTISFHFSQSNGLQNTMIWYHTVFSYVYVKVYIIKILSNIYIAITHNIYFHFKFFCTTNTHHR